MTSPQGQHFTKRLSSRAASCLRLGSTSALFFALGFGFSAGEGNVPQQQIAGQDLRVAFQQSNEVHPIEQLVQLQSRHFVACGLVRKDNEYLPPSHVDSEACAAPDQPQQIPEHRVRLA